MFTVIVIEPKGDQFIDSAVTVRQEITHVKKDKSETRPKVKWWRENDPTEYYVLEGRVRIINENGKQVIEYNL